MQPKPYKGRYPEVTRLLYEKGVLLGYPTQIERKDLTYDEGVDIVYTLKNMTPARFKDTAEALLLAAFTEAERYSEYKYKFVKFVVKLNRNTKGRKMGYSQKRDYIASKHTDPEIMVYGEEALGYTLPEEYKKHPFLVDKVQEILNIPDSTSPGPYVDQQKPYKVDIMVISIRAGLNDKFEKIDRSGVTSKREELGK